ncbi:Secreted protein [Pseudomonas sp. IT-P44]
MRREWLAIPVSSEVRPMWAFVATYASCLLWLLKHSVRRRNQPAAVDEMKRLDKAYCYTVQRLCISTLHVSLIIRVLPRAESAAGWHLP